MSKNDGTKVELTAIQIALNRGLARLWKEEPNPVAEEVLLREARIRALAQEVYLRNFSAQSSAPVTPQEAFDFAEDFEREAEGRFEALKLNGLAGLKARQEAQAAAQAALEAERAAERMNDPF